MVQFSNETRISPDVVAEKNGIPVIHGRNYYIDEAGVVCTYNKVPTSVYNSEGLSVDVTSLSQITDYIFIINKKLAYKTADGILVTDLDATKEKYVGGFQGIAGFDSNDYRYTFQNNTTSASTVSFTARINNNKQLEIQCGNNWVIPLGEFRCYINEVFYNINYHTTMPNSFGDTFTVFICGFDSGTTSPETNYIRDLFIQGNTLYLSTRTKLIGSQPYDWKMIDTGDSTVVWSEDSRLNGGYFAGSPAASMFYVVNKNTGICYWCDASDFSIKQEYTHHQPILGFASVDKYMLAIVDKEALTAISAYTSLNTWLIRTRIYFKFNQLSAYEDMLSEYTEETIAFDQTINSLLVKSSQRANMLFYIVNDKILSGCHAEQAATSSDFGTYVIEDKKLYRYKKVEESGEYTPVSENYPAFDSYIYIGSDLEPDVGGSTFRDTEILFEGKITVNDGDVFSVESSGDKPISDEPVRTNQDKPDNWWYLYSKTLRYPVSYTDWLQISLMPTTRIFQIKLAIDATDKTQKTK